MKNFFKSLEEEQVSVTTLEDQMKVELLFEAYKKFSLEELESKLGGNKFFL